tara:strand:+ start:4534 stop:5121 length:588 start_codon:yes stop_codon:yes gene_type:complete
LTETKKQPIEQKKNIMGWLDKFKKVINKNTQAKKEDEFLEKIQKKYDIKSKARHEKEKEAETDYLNESLDTIDSFRDIFAGGDLSDQFPSLRRRHEESNEDQLDRLADSVEKYSEKEKAEKLKEVTEALNEKLSENQEAFANNLNTGISRPDSSIFDPVTYPVAYEQQMKDAAPDLVKRFRKSLTQDEKPVITKE